jgi:hypothetical protein
LSSVKCQAWSVKSNVYIECRVCSEKCDVQSVECKV